jgi:uncharacterized Zn-binding protein involved in type VI secretion
VPPAARLTDMHVCPMVTPGVPPIPHVGGPITGPGAPTILIDFMPAANVTSMAVCVGPPDIVAMGSAGVFLNFLPAARLGDQCAHGGAIVMGSPTCEIGEVGAPSPGAAGAATVMAGILNSGIIQQQLAQTSVLATQGTASSTSAPPVVGVVCVRTAEVVNAEMVANGMEPAWAPGTLVTTEVLPVGSEFEMVADPDRLDDIMRGNTRTGNWATTDSIADQKFARDNLALTTQFKPDVSTVIKVKTKTPVMVNRGTVGPMGSLPGGANQVQFLNNHPGAVGPSSPPRLLS